MLTALSTLPCYSQGNQETTKTPIYQFETKDFSRLIGIKGLSNKLLEQHFELYRGYVRQTNAMSTQLLASLEQKPFSPLEYSSLKKSFAFEYNGMKLHELFFENLSKNKISMNSGMFLKQVLQDYSSLDNWFKELTQTAMTRGIGWVVCYLDTNQNQLISTWIESHDKGPLLEAHPLVVIDLWEHAYITDYGINRVDYMKTILASLDWNVIEERYQKAIESKVEK